MINFIVWIIVGGLIGCVASMIMRTNMAEHDGGMAFEVYEIERTKEIARL